MEPTLSSPRCFFLISWWVSLCLRCAAGARYERTAAKRKPWLPPRCAAKLGQARNEINGRDPRSGKGPVYVGFELDASVAERHGATRVQSVGDENLPEIYATLSRANLSRHFFL